MDFTERYHECDRPLRRFIASRFPSCITDDVISDTWYQAWINFASFNHHGSFLTWLFSIAKHVGLNTLRRIGRYNKLLVALVYQDSHESQVIARVDCQRILNSVSATHAAIIFLPWLGYTDDDLGRKAGMTSVAVRQSRFRIVRNIRKSV